MLFITVEGVRMNVAHIARYVQSRDGVKVTFVQGHTVMVVNAKVEQLDKAINSLANTLAALQQGYAR